jgi:hypothetical protein
LFGEDVLPAASGKEALDVRDGETPLGDRDTVLTGRAAFPD